MLVPYGDYGDNTGPIDVIAIAPNGVATTLFTSFDTEAIRYWHTFTDGSVWASAVDSKTNTASQLVTNHGGTWHTVTAQPPGLEVAVHLFDCWEGDDGAVLTCGSRGPDNAIVWASYDHGATWVEELSIPGTDMTAGAQRFYEFSTLTDGRTFVRRYDGELGGFARDASAKTWTYVPDPTFAPDVVTLVEDPPWSGVTRLEVDGVFVTRLPGAPWFWSVSLSPDGSVWLTDHINFFRIPLT